MLQSLPEIDLKLLLSGDGNKSFYNINNTELAENGAKSNAFKKRRFKSRHKRQLISEEELISFLLAFFALLAIIGFLITHHHPENLYLLVFGVSGLLFVLSIVNDP